MVVRDPTCETASPRRTPSRPARRRPAARARARSRGAHQGRRGRRRRRRGHALPGLRDQGGARRRRGGGRRRPRPLPCPPRRDRPRPAARGAAARRGQRLPRALPGGLRDPRRRRDARPPGVAAPPDRWPRRGRLAGRRAPPGRRAARAGRRPAGHQPRATRPVRPAAQLLRRPPPPHRRGAADPGRDRRRRAARRAAEGVTMLLRLWRTHLGSRPGLIVGLVLLQLASTLAALALPSLNGRIIDDGVAKGDTGYILRAGAVMLGVSLVQVLATVGVAWIASRCSSSLAARVRSDLFARVGRFSAREMGRFGAPTLISRSTNDVQQVQLVTNMGLAMMLSAPIMMIGGIIMALQEEAGLAWLVAVA